MRGSPTDAGNSAFRLYRASQNYGDKALPHPGSLADRVRSNPVPFYPKGRRDASQMYRIERGWVDTAGRCRTWFLLDENGAKVAEITTKRDALKLVRLLDGKE
jgi:hypothetical protein